MPHPQTVRLSPDDAETLARALGAPDSWLEIASTTQLQVWFASRAAELRYAAARTPMDFGRPVGHTDR